MQQHPQAVNRARAPLGGGRQPRRPAGPVDDVGRDLPRAQGGQRQLGRGVRLRQPQAGRVDDQRRLAGDELERLGREGHRVAQLRRPRGGAVGHAHARAPRAQGVDHRPRRAPGPHHQRVGPGQLERRLLVERAQEAGRVGVVGAEAAVAVGHQRVRRPDRHGRRGRRRRRPQRGELVRDGGVQAGAAGRGEAGDGLLGPLGRHREGDVGPVEPEGREGRVVHRRREGVLDGPADDAGDPRPAVDHPARLARDFCTSCANCSGVLEK